MGRSQEPAAHAASANRGWDVLKSGALPALLPVVRLFRLHFCLFTRRLPTTTTTLIKQVNHLRSATGWQSAPLWS